MVESEVKEDFVKQVASTLDWGALRKAASEASYIVVILQQLLLNSIGRLSPRCYNSDVRLGPARAALALLVLNTI